MEQPYTECLLITCYCGKKLICFSFAYAENTLPTLLVVAHYTIEGQKKCIYKTQKKWLLAKPPFTDL